MVDVRVALLVAIASLAGACAKAPEPDASQTAPQAQAQETPQVDTVTTEQGESGIQIHGGGAGGLAPVTGTESLQGGGAGNMHNQIKDKAKGVAAGSSASQLDGE